MGIRKRYEAMQHLLEEQKEYQKSIYKLAEDLEIDVDLNDTQKTEVELKRKKLDVDIAEELMKEHLFLNIWDCFLDTEETSPGDLFRIPDGDQKQGWTKGEFQAG